MTLTHSPAITPIAFQLAAALERYQATFDDMMESWFDRNRCHAVVRQLDEIRKLRGALPQLAVDMMEVSMRHRDLLQSLWARAAKPGAVVAAEIAALRSRHHAAIEGMRQKCLRLLARNR